MSCTSADVANLDPPGLVSYLESTTYDCLKNFVWTFDENISSVLSAPHLIAVLNRIATVSPEYQGDNQQHLLELMHFAHAAYYWQFYHPDEPGLFDPNTPTVKTATKEALNAFALNTHFNDLNSTAAKILYDWVNIVDGAMLGHLYYEQLVGILTTFNTEQARWDEYYQRSLAYTTLVAIRRQTNLNAAFPARIDQNLIGQLSTLSQDTSLPTKAQYLATNAIWVLGAFCKNVAAWKTAAVQALTSARAVWPLNSQQGLRTIMELCECNECQDASGTTLSRDDIASQLEAQLLPNTHTFDDGAMIVRTPLTLDQVQPLYHAVKEVEAQFNRLTQTIAPLPDDRNGVLKVIIFGSKADYENCASFLFDISTGNGGIYIEQRGTLYTYERTAADSIYPLEELLRHEFAHYLVGRFLIEGMWGEAPIYEDDRMVWFDEGLAEFCTWSSSDEGIKPRKRLVGRVQGDGNYRMPVSQVLNSTYVNFKFYRYAAFLFAYWYENDLATLLRLIDLARAGDVTGYDTKIDELKRDANLQTTYDQYLDSLIANIGELDDPSTVVPPLNELNLATPAEVQTRVRQTRIGYRAECTVAAAEMNTRFSARGTLSGKLGGQRDLVAAWQTFDANLDEMIKALKQQGINNFVALNGRFGMIRWVDYGSGQSYPMADYYVDGPLVHGGAAPQLTPEQVTADFRSTRLGTNATATLLDSTTVKVTLALTTGLHPKTTPDTVLLAELEDARTELRNQVYAIRPQYYRDFVVNWDGDMRTIATTNRQKYGLRKTVCEVRHEPAES